MSCVFSRPGLEPELARDMVALEVRQPDVEDDDVGTKRARDVDRGHAVDRELHLVAHHLDQQRHRVHRVEVVLDHEDAPLGRGIRLEAKKSGHGLSLGLLFLESCLDVQLDANPVAEAPAFIGCRQSNENLVVT